MEMLGEVLNSKGEALNRNVSQWNGVDELINDGRWRGGSQMLRITEINGNDVSFPEMEEGEEE